MFGCFESIAGRLLFGRVWARLRCVMCPRAGGCFFSFRGCRLVTCPHVVTDRFVLCFNQVPRSFRGLAFGQLHIFGASADSSLCETFIQAATSVRMAQTHPMEDYCRG